MRLYKNFFKRLLDIFLIGIFFPIWFTIFFIVLLLLLATQSSPYFYRGKRVGKDLVNFNIIKFRTLNNKSGTEITGDTVTKNDVRLTKFGSVLRKFKLDEIPQLFLILSGKMSIVGPRPELPIYVNKDYYLKHGISDVRPGLTDFSSIKYFKLAEIIPENDTNNYVYNKIIPKKNILRRLYVKKMSFITDMQILWLTLKKYIL